MAIRVCEHFLPWKVFLEKKEAICGASEKALQALPFQCTLFGSAKTGIPHLAR